MALLAGIDPGRGGALVLIDHDARFVASLNRHDGVPVVIANFLREHAAGIVLACMEKPGFSPHNGAKSSREAGMHLGMMHGILAALAIPLQEVASHAWQGPCGLVLPAPSAALAAAKKGDDRKLLAKMLSARRVDVKTATMHQALARWPTLPIRAKRDWDLADAAYLAEYARRMHLGLIRQAATAGHSRPEVPAASAV